MNLDGWQPRGHNVYIQTLHHPICLSISKSLLFTSILYVSLFTLFFFWRLQNPGGRCIISAQNTIHLHAITASPSATSLAPSRHNPKNGHPAFRDPPRDPLPPASVLLALGAPHIPPLQRHTRPAVVPVCPVPIAEDTPTCCASVLICEYPN